MNKELIWDTIIIGAGPAGLMAAITIARQKKKVLMLESGAHAGKKLLITGGGHCNISNRKVSEKDYQSGQLRTVRNILRAFSPETTRRFFSGIGVEFSEEEDGNFFPESRSAKSVLGALLDETSKCGVKFESLRKATRIEREKDVFVVSGSGFSYKSRTVILVTGGLSYPETGSDGSGYALARSLGHAIVPTTPALVPFILNDPAWNSLTGITLPAELSLVQNGKEIASVKGPLLFTHGGLSGPSVMDLSRHWIRLENKSNAELLFDFLPDQAEDQFQAEIAEIIKKQPALSLKKALARKLPERLVEVLLGKSGLDSRMQMAHCSKQDKHRLVQTIFSLSIRVDSAAGYEKAEVTAGGIDMAQVDAKALESKLCPGIFFAGEILDVDGRIGGFNLQWAWASGHAVGEAVVKKLGLEAEIN